MIRPDAARTVARNILEAAAPANVTDQLVDLAATLIKIAVETDEIAATNETLRQQLEDLSRPVEHAHSRGTDCTPFCPAYRQ